MTAAQQTIELPARAGSVVCAWCRHEGRDDVPAVDGCEHINGKYDTDHLCAECFDWLQNGPPTLEQILGGSLNNDYPDSICKTGNFSTL